MWSARIQNRRNLMATCRLSRQLALVAHKNDVVSVTSQNEILWEGETIPMADVKEDILSLLDGLIQELCTPSVNLIRA